MSLTINTEGLLVANTTYAPVTDTCIQNGAASKQSLNYKAQLTMDGSPEQVGVTEIRHVHLEWRYYQQ